MSRLVNISWSLIHYGCRHSGYPNLLVIYPTLIDLTILLFICYVLYLRYTGRKDFFALSKERSLRFIFVELSRTTVFTKHETKLNIFKESTLEKGNGWASYLTPDINHPTHYFISCFHQLSLESLVVLN